MSLLIRTFLGQGTQGIEASWYLQEKKSNEMPLVRATESGPVQTESVIVILRKCSAWTYFSTIF